MTPNNNCGCCTIWLAMDEKDGIPREEAIKKYCSFCYDGVLKLPQNNKGETDVNKKIYN